jgi:excisionase family DNA binding protein
LDTPGKGGSKRLDGAAAVPKKERNVAQRFLQLAEVSEILNISAAQAYALVRSGELPAIKVGGRGQWRVEATELENYIQRMYAETRSFVEAHPFGGAGEE